MGDLERGQVQQSDSDPKVQTLQVEVWGPEDVRDDLEHWEPVGISHRPKDPDSNGGADALVGKLGGSDHSVVLGVTDRRIRPTGMAQGDTVLYDAHGNRLDLTSAGGSFNCDVSVDETVTSEKTINAKGGFKKDAKTGVSGLLTVNDSVSGGFAIIEVTGGIITTVTVNPPFTWVPAGS